jgi:hypothetical protein
MSFLRLLPMTLVVVILYNVTVFGGVAIHGADAANAVGAAGMMGSLGAKLITIKLVNGSWDFTFGTLIVTLGLVALFIELLRSTRTDTISIANHALSVMVLILCLLEFVVVRGFSTSEFFYLTVIAAIDVVAGFTVTIIGARRDFGGHGLAV